MNEKKAENNYYVFSIGAFAHSGVDLKANFSCQYIMNLLRW